MPRCHSLGIAALVDVGQLVNVLVVDGIGQAVAELQLGNELEKWKVEVAAQSYLDHRVVAFQLYVVLILA